VKTSYLFPFLSVLSFGAAGACDAADETAAEPECDLVRYRDVDGDLKGDPSHPNTACAPGPGWVDNSDDCNDSHPYVNADEEEVCDGLDNDCRATTGEEALCKKAACKAAVNPATKTSYLFCETQGTGEQLLDEDCSALGFRPAQIEDQAENDFLVAQARVLLGTADPLIFLGGFRSGGVWRWADDAQFWPDPRTGTAPYTSWQASAPAETDGTTNTCLALEATTNRPGWVAAACSAAQIVVCERD
jgi:hypothetical protein